MATPPLEPCADCDRLREVVEKLHAERDEALLALARERERVALWQLGYPPSPAPVHVPPPSPLRHQIADFLNAQVKGNSVVHTRLKSFMNRALTTAREKVL